MHGRDSCAKFKDHAWDSQFKAMVHIPGKEFLLWTEIIASIERMINNKGRIAMKFYMMPFIWIVCLLSVSAQDEKKVNAVILGAYQISECDWSGGESGYRIENAIVRDFVSHQYAWVLKDLVVKHDPEYCIVHAGIEDFFLQIHVETALHPDRCR